MITTLTEPTADVKAETVGRFTRAVPVTVGNVTPPVPATPVTLTSTFVITVKGGSSVTVGGVAGSGEVGTVLVWGRIIPEEDTVWTQIIAA